MRLRPSKNRSVQCASTAGRALFDARAKAVFLEWFGATCNARIAAARAGVAYQTVFKHRKRDPAFADAWEAALEQGYAVLEARLVAEAIDFERGIASEDEPALGPAEIDAIAAEARGVVEQISFEQRLALLREYRRAGGGRGPRTTAKAHGLTGRQASEDEVEAELIRRLKIFALRQAQDRPNDTPIKVVL